MKYLTIILLYFVILWGQESSPTKTESFQLPSDTLMLTKKYVVTGKSSGKIKIIKHDSLIYYDQWRVLYTNDNEAVITTEKEEENLLFALRFNPPGTFKDYPAAVYKGRLALPDFSTNKDAKRFITRIKEGCKDGINFAGHYTIVTWGCGSPCQDGVAVDRKTGRIYDGFGSNLGLAFQKDSKLLVVNVGAVDSVSGTINSCVFCSVSYFKWEKKRLINFE